MECNDSTFLLICLFGKACGWVLVGGGKRWGFGVVSLNTPPFCAHALEHLALSSVVAASGRKIHSLH